ncbi:MAG: GAF domain-containing protein [Anaerolineales bacterium]|nr:GAF domain-containing protein [Anaerolineales bacterium]
MSTQSTIPALESQLSQLNQTVDQIRREVANYREETSRAGVGPPSHVTDGLIELSNHLNRLGKVVEGFEIERRNLEALVDIGQVVNSSLDLTTVLNEVMDTIIRLTGAQRAFLMLPDEKGAMDMVVARNWEQESLEPEEYNISSTIVNRVLTDGEAILTTNASEDPRFGSQDSIVAYNLRSILCVPLKVKGKLTGVVYADNRIREGLFTEKERSLLSAFANQAAVALENAMLFASVQQTLDEVTELKNLMEDVFASIASGVITTNTSDEITLCNRAAESILGIPSFYLLGASLRETLHPISPDLIELVNDVKDSDQRFIGLEVQTDLQNRGTVDLALNITPLKTADQSTTGVAIVVDDLTEKKRLEAQRRLFERMVSPGVINQLDPDSLKLGGRRTILTTIFADIRGFTSLGESTEPETLVSVLNLYLAVAAEAILQEEGTIDKFLGDAVMAWFNAPIQQTDHTLRAVRASLAIMESAKKLVQEMPPEFKLSFGIGIDIGEALLGLIGTQKRLEYTAIGDTVNTAKRLQENAQPGQILISESAAQEVLETVILEPVPPILAEGKGQPLEVFEVVGLQETE